jgi:hypothetical protein
MKHLDHFPAPPLKLWHWLIGSLLILGGAASLFTYPVDVKPVEIQEIIVPVLVMAAGVAELCWQIGKHTAHSQMQYTQYCASVEKDILIQVVDSREYSDLEKQIVLGILNKQYPGWSINVESTAAI